MKSHLEKYLQDHMAGAAFAVDLLEALCRKHENASFHGQLQSLLIEIKDDRDELSRIAASRGIEAGGIKEGISRFMEKLSRPKLVSDPDDIFSSFEACEMLALGIIGKKSLWDALSIALRSQSGEVDFERLKQRAEAQHAVIEKLRLGLAENVLNTSPHS